MDVHALGLASHVRTLYGSDELSDLIVVLSAQPQEASTSAAGAAGDASRKRGRDEDGQEPPAQQEAHVVAGTRIAWPCARARCGGRSC